MKIPHISPRLAIIASIAAIVFIAGIAIGETQPQFGQAFAAVPNAAPDGIAAGEEITGTTNLIIGNDQSGGIAIGLPRVHTPIGVYLEPDDGNYYAQQGTFNILPGTKIVSVKTNFSEDASFIVAGGTVTITTKYGISGAVMIWYKSAPTAKANQAVGIGTAPADKMAAAALANIPDGTGTYAVPLTITRTDLDATTIIFAPASGQVTRVYANLGGGKKNISFAPGGDNIWRLPPNVTVGMVGGGANLVAVIKK